MLAIRTVAVLLLVSVIVSCGSSPKGEGVDSISEPGTFLKAEIQERIAAIPYQTEQVLYDNLLRLSYIGEPAIPFLVDALSDRDPRTRGSCAFVLGHIRDRRTIPALRKALDDPINSVRYEAAVALGNIGDRGGYPVLVAGLADEDIRSRYKAHEALTLLTGLDFGYKHDDSPADRRTAVLKWEAWLDKMEADPR